ncbi:MAG: histone H1 [Halobacteriovorax sp.]|nr:histone H1 [Halobacteriovorax sp.]|tara:strand:- start:22584 stop:22784 length:201 start_codon:yes stop_codon:yes gene_type:complete
MSSKIVDKWSEVKVLVESLDLDVLKNANGNNSAGVRARRGLRLLKTSAAELVKLTIEEEKTRKGAK